MSDYVPNVIPFNAKSHTPEVILSRTLAKKDRIARVWVVIEWDDSSFDCDWSFCNLKEMSYAARVLDLASVEEMRAAKK